jgi:hypothetical protein
MPPIYEVVGDVMGDVMGDYYDEGIGADAPPPAQPPAGHWRHGATAARHPASNVPQRRQMVIAHPSGQGGQVLVQKPAWRDGQLAPGVMAPDEGMVPLGMVPDNGTGTFTAAGAAKITWTGQLQKPFRAERLLVSSVRTGATAVGRLLGQFFVGVDLNMATLQPVDIELYGSATAFGTRLTLLQAPPGVLIQVPVTLSSALTAPDTVFATVQWSGRIIH